ncbi:hypothetical protein AACN20_004003 [Escherichia coli]|nr:hypothetical protein [Escherichia coli]
MAKIARTFLKLHQPFHQFISANNKPTIGSRQFLKRKKPRAINSGLYLTSAFIHR